MIEFSAKQIAGAVGGKVHGDETRTVHDVAPIETAEEGQLSFVCEAKYLPALQQTHASVVLVSSALAQDTDMSSLRCTVVEVENSRAAMAELLQAVAETLNPRKHGVEQPCFIAEGVSVPADAYIGAMAYIGRNVKLGKGVQIYPQAYIGDNVQIGDNSIVYAGAKIYYNCAVGKECIIHAGAVIGADGFGFEPDKDGVYHKLPQIGRVVIEDDVEIGANTTIDRAMMGETRISRNTKIDNLVQIAHNVQVGGSTVLCAQVGIAGSTSIGSHCTLTGQVGVAGHIEVTDHCIVGAQSGISGSLRKPGMYIGSPAIDAATWRRAIVKFRQSGRK